ncbi:hypothetical protein RI578_22680 [Streptomyces sp. BB1-1-1]|uniref:hypothetical protein n=1 Tax=Streptomyces sp. BB1-1-1 TaxID=3074430 RepID=UPI002877EBC8|nr:hypothetical protein [Streptomyces sp. BB1-1-1]WND36916.1 hypothetical protein RI578_22680 [Streptomyces sp. BB1-1-1]
MTVRAAWLLLGGTGNPGQTREDTRLAPVGTMLPDGELRTRPGILPGGDPFAATGAGAMSLQIGVGRSTVQGTTAQGAYPVCLDAPEVVTFTDGDALFDRIDTVILHVYDALFDDQGQNLARVEVVVGDATETPTAPTLDPACLPLWDVTIPAGASAGVGGIDWTSALTDRRRYTVAVGGVIPQAASSDVGAYDGQYADIDGTLYRWSAADAAWQVYRAPVETVGWTEPALASGYTNSGNSQGNVAYRVITLGGVRHMQWRGGVSWATNSEPPGSGYVLAGTLPADCRPKYLVSTPMAAGGLPMKCDFQTGGRVRFIDNTSVTDWASFNSIIYPLDA